MGGIVAVFVLAFLGQWLLVGNPGYFSHDELQWASFAGVDGPIHWVKWLDVAAFQYRPLTFNLWLWLSRHLFDTPQAFHAVLAAWGAGNAVLLGLLSRRLGVATRPAFIGAVVFALSPYAVYVQGWVGTLADLAWVGCALLVGLLVVSRARTWVRVVGTMLLTLAALLAKEAAVAIPLVLAVAAWLEVGAAEAATADGGGDSSRGFRRSHREATLWAMVVSGAVVAVYLVLRLGVLLHATGQPSQYQLDFAQAPQRWLEYLLFPFMPSVFEVFSAGAHALRGSGLLAMVLWIGVVVACWRTSWRLALFLVVGGLAALAPVLPLPASSNQYGYGFAALGVATIAAAWPRANRWLRAAIALAAVACLWHGVNVMRTIRHVGEVQAVFSPALAEAVRAHGDAPLRLRVAPDADEWIFKRLSFDIPSYRGVPIGDRVRLVAADAPADATVRADGSIVRH
jgi:hypothetical protein